MEVQNKMADKKIKVELKEDGPASYTAKGTRILKGKGVEVSESLANRLSQETNNKGDKIFDIKGEVVSSQEEESKEEQRQDEGPDEQPKPTKNKIMNKDRFNELDEGLTVPQLKEKADKMGIEYKVNIVKKELIMKILEKEAEQKADDK